VIPRKVHFIWISSPDYGIPKFGFIEWLAVRSALKTNPEFEVHFWTDHEPAGKYWESVRDFVWVGPIKPPESVFGNPIPHPAHKCDWLRLQVIQEHGGVYLDLDTIAVGDLTDLMMLPTTMVLETANNEAQGLCNAFIASKPNTEFIADWIEKFRDFRSKGRDQYWAESAVKWPYQLMRSGHLVESAPPHAFFKPDWTPEGIAAMFDRVVEFPHAVGFHLWSVITRPRLNTFNEYNFAANDCTFARIVERTLGDEIRTELV
jgi:hypothetical protein